MSHRRIANGRSALASFSAAKRRAMGDSVLQPLDLFLTGLSSSVAVYAAAASLASEKNAQFFMWLVMAGTVVSAFVVWFLGRSKFVLADATAYTVVALTAAFGITTLNDLCPDNIYVGPLTMAGILSWMLALGSFTVWRDQTMLFQAVPAIALFGLVGCYDTFRASVIYFFVFLICQAILLSRAHGRSMLRQARSSGVEALEMAAMRKGPWRWMAGPEWALASALTIVLISTVGAPILRDSASGFSGLVKYTPPVSPLVQPSLSAIQSGSVRVGTGPNAVNDSPVLRAELPEPLYLRGYIFGRYVEGAWQPRSGSIDIGIDPVSFVLADISDPVRIKFRIEPLQISNSTVPVPGEDISLTTDAYYPNMGGSLSTRQESPFPVCEGTAVIFGGKSKIRDVDPEMGQMEPDYVQLDGIPNDVRAFAKEVTRGAKTDYDKAVAIQHAIERTVKYNLNAGRTPEKQDPVSYFLFDSKEGYCDLFASAMTLMARSVGLPARYVTGYYPFEGDQEEPNKYVVRQRDAHAWCEVFFKGGGWVVFDATEGAASVAGSGRGSTNDRTFWQTGWFLMAAIFAGAAGAGWGAFLLVGRMRKYASSPGFAERHLLRTQIRLRSKLRRQFLSYEQELRRELRRPRGIGETLFEYTQAASAKIGHRAPLAWETGSAFASAFYAGATLDEATVSDLQSRVKALKQARRSKSR